MGVVPEVPKPSTVPIAAHATRAAVPVASHASWHLARQRR
jgi:hypothetical protein